MYFGNIGSDITGITRDCDDPAFRVAESSGTETPPQSVQYTTCQRHVGNSVQAYPSHSLVTVKNLRAYKYLPQTGNFAAKPRSSCLATSLVAIPGPLLALLALKMLHSFISKSSLTLLVLFATHFRVCCASIHDLFN
jgi:hypothetical protein